MMNKKTAKKSLFMSAISLLLCISMLVGTTFAWFTDSVTSGRNTIQSGNLDVTLDYWDGDSFEPVDGDVKLFDDAALWEPGYTEVAYLKVGNDGSLALKYQLNVNVYSEDPGTNKAGEEFKLSDYLVFKVVEIDEVTVGTYDRAAAMAAAGSELGLKSYNGEYKSLEKNGDADYVALVIYMPTTVGNEANHNGDAPSIQLGVELVATQFASESDSFDKNYDEFATYEDFADPDITATQTKTLVEGASKLSFALSYGGTDIVDVTVPADAIADPSQPVTVTINAIDPASTIEVGENTKAYAYDISVTNLKEGLTEDQLVTVVAYAPNALAVMDAYHNGELIEGAVYDEVTGTVTFKTGSFSPYAFSYEEMSVGTLAALREAVKKNNVEIKLTSDLTIDLTAGSADRSEEHVLATSSKTYYNAVNIIGQNVAINLNGHKITVKCSDTYNGNQDVGALFFVDKSGSLNIIDRENNGGYIKMASSIYMVWAPYESPSYMDIYNGVFIADSYAGDPIGTSSDPDSADGTMQNENSNRALVYAGTGGNMNIYGGYFLYNNTPNDVLNRNNGAFNATNGYEGDRPFITIHEGVMLIDNAYRQDPTNTSEFKNILKEHPDAKPTDPGIMDNSSIKLAKDCEVAEISKSVTIDGETYSTWYQVVADITSITASAKKGVYDKSHTFGVDDFNVYAITKNGASGKITNFTVAVDATTGIATITYTSDTGKVLTTTCSISQMNLTLLDENRIRLPIKDPNSDATAPFFSTGNFGVSGWANLVNAAYSYDYFANNNLTYTAPNGETVTGFNNKYGDWGNTYWNNYYVEGKYSEGYYGLTIENAKPYTTLGINCVVGCLEDAPQLKGFGVYINDDLSTLKWNAPAIVYTEGDMYNSFGWNNGHSLLEINCADFEPGKTYEVHWVLVFEDGVTSLCDWTVTMAEASASDAVFTDTEKPNANVIIMAGQSNMFGPAPLTQEIIDNYKNVDYSNVFIKYANINFDVDANGNVLNSMSTVFSNSDFQQYEVGIGAQGDSYFGPELALAYQLATNPAFADQQWYIVKYAPAGTALASQWTSGCSIDGKTTTLTDDMLDYVQTAIESLSDDFDVHVRSFMWMQGESDASTSASASNYGTLEKTLVSRVRDTFAAYATRSVGSVPGSGISFIDAGIAEYRNQDGVVQNGWIYSSDVNAGKVGNCQYWCSLPAMSYENYTPTYGPLKGIQYQANAPTQMNPTGGNIVNSIFIDTHHLLSKAAAHSLPTDHELYEDYGNASDNADQAHYSAGSMEALGQLYASCLQYMIQQNG